MTGVLRERTSARRARGIVVGPLVVIVAIAANLAYHALASSKAAPPRIAVPLSAWRSPSASSSVWAEGALPDGTTVFADALPGLTKLDPALLVALRRAATDAADDGVELLVDSGWRSREYQERLFRQAISKYGSEQEAARWVATPGTSPHVSGDAVDIGPTDATAWLSEHGPEYGLCQIYTNEPWHYELRPAARGGNCPPMYTDPTHDPRMQQ